MKAFHVLEPSCNQIISIGRVPHYSANSIAEAGNIVGIHEARGIPSYFWHRPNIAGNHRPAHRVGFYNRQAKTFVSRGKYNNITDLILQS